MIRSNDIEGTTDEDRRYCGSRFSDLQKALFSNPYQTIWGSEGEPPMPVYRVTLSSILQGMLPFVRPSSFEKAAERAVDSSADLR